MTSETIYRFILLTNDGRYGRVTLFMTIEVACCFILFPIPNSESLKPIYDKITTLSKKEQFRFMTIYQLACKINIEIQQKTSAEYSLFGRFSYI
jgi:hypothetical protein